MTDWLTKTQRSYNMSSIRSRGNATTEQRLAALLRLHGIKGWRRHADLPGKPDFVFRSGHVAVFVDGCFWHGCPSCYKMPGDNRRYWSEKIDRNRTRDRRNTRLLRRKGWRVIHVWEHSLKNGLRSKAVMARIARSLN